MKKRMKEGEKEKKNKGQKERKKDNRNHYYVQRKSNENKSLSKCFKRTLAGQRQYFTL